MSKTDENLAAAFAGESQARNRYTYFADAARKEGLNYIGKIFDETAENEKRHAKEHFLLLGLLGDTASNLKVAIEGEDNTAAATLCSQLAKVEAHHRDRYKALLQMVEDGTVFKRDEPITWKCSVCGYVLDGTEPPPKCPCCKHPQNFFEPANLDF